MMRIMPAAPLPSPAVAAPAAEPGPQPTLARPPASALARAGAVAGTLLVLASAIAGSGHGERFVRDLPWMGVFAVVGLIEAALAARLLDGLALRGGLGAEVARGNLAAAVASSGHRLAAAWAVSRCLYGADLFTLAVGAAFASIAVGTLLLFQVLHRRLTHYADDQELRAGNVAVAVSHTGLSLALAIIVGHAAEGSFEGWAASLRAYGAALLLGLLLYPVRQLVVKRMLCGFPIGLRGRELDRAIAQDRDAVAAAVEALVYVAAAIFVTGVA